MVHQFSKLKMMRLYCTFSTLKMYNSNTFQALSLDCQIGPTVQCQPIFAL